MKLGISSLLIVLGCACFLAATYQYYQRVNPNKLAFEEMPTSNVDTESVKPVRITIPNLQIDIPTITVRLHGATWPTTDEGAAYLENTPPPGENGNSVIYGHNYHNIFGKLTKIKPGDKIIITMADGSERQFMVRLTQEVNPDQTNILRPSNKPKLTLYTCSGLFDTKRFVAVASLL